MMTLIGIVAGDVLNFLENRRDAVSIDDVCQKLQYPEYMIYMAVGSLIRDGYARMAISDGQKFVSAVVRTDVLPGMFGEVVYSCGLGKCV